MEAMDGHVKEGMKCGSCGCVHHKAVPLLIVAFALAFLGGTLGWWSDRTVAITWPIIVGAAGITKLCGTMCKCC